MDLQNKEIVINPSTFSQTTNSSSLENINNKWFINLSNHIIPKKVQCLLQHGDNFAIPTTNTKKICFEIMKNLENNSCKINFDTFEAIRNRTISILNNHTPNHSIANLNIKKISQIQKTTKEFTKNNPQIIFTRADKGNMTVALDQTQYKRTMSLMLQDRDTYDIINKDPTRTLTNKVREILTRWSKNNYITMNTHKKIYCSDGVLPRAYGLPKIHKPGEQYRIIVSSIDSPLYSLASYLHQILNDHIPKPKSHIKNSLQLIDRLKNVTLNNNQTLISLDVKKY